MGERFLCQEQKWASIHHVSGNAWFLRFACDQCLGERLLFKRRVPSVIIMPVQTNMALVNVAGFNKPFVPGSKAEWPQSLSIKLNPYFSNHIWKMIESICTSKNIFIAFIHFVYKCISLKYFQLRRELNVQSQNT